MSKKKPASDDNEDKAVKLVRESAKKLGLLPVDLPKMSEDENLFDEFSPVAGELLPETPLPNFDVDLPAPCTPSKKESKAPHYHGHRDRVKQRLLESDGESLADYELLEAILFRALPRRDTKPIAKELLQRFGSFAEVINASEGELRKIKWIKDAAIGEFALIRASTKRLLKSGIVKRPVLTSWARVLDHCRAAMAFEPREQFRILFLDKRNRLILDEVQQTGTIDHTPVYVREICRRALELNATALILAHNHPSGDPTPSRGDIEMTKEIVKVANGLGIKVHDHIILAKEGHASFKGLGLI